MAQKWGPKRNPAKYAKLSSRLDGSSPEPSPEGSQIDDFLEYLFRTLLRPLLGDAWRHFLAPWGPHGCPQGPKGVPKGTPKWLQNELKIETSFLVHFWSGAGGRGGATRESSPLKN